VRAPFLDVRGIRDHELVDGDVLAEAFDAQGRKVAGGSAMLSSSEVMDVFKPGSHGSTCGGNPLA